MKLVTLIACLGIASCATGSDEKLPTKIIWHADKRFTDVERQKIIEGDAWLSLQSGHEPSEIIFDFDPPPGLWDAFTIRRERGILSNGTGATGLCMGGAVFLDVDSLGKIEYLPGLTSHEMAHCRFRFKDGYRPGDKITEGIMRVLYPMRWTELEEEQCRETNCRMEGK